MSKIYPRGIFEFFPNHIRVTIIFKNNVFMINDKQGFFFNRYNLNEIQISILKGYTA